MNGVCITPHGERLPVLPDYRVAWITSDGGRVWLAPDWMLVLVHTLGDLSNSVSQACDLARRAWPSGVHIESVRRQYDITPPLGSGLTARLPAAFNVTASLFAASRAEVVAARLREARVTQVMQVVPAGVQSWADLHRY